MKKYFEFQIQNKKEKKEEFYLKNLNIAHNLKRILSTDRYLFFYHLRYLQSKWYLEYLILQFHNTLNNIQKNADLKSQNHSEKVLSKERNLYDSRKKHINSLEVLRNFSQQLDHINFKGDLVFHLDFLKVC